MSTTTYQDPYGPGGAWHEWAESLSPDRAAHYRSARWKAKRRERRALDGYRCVVCGLWDQGKLVCHHISYEHFGDEPMEDLRTVCVDCHENASEEELAQEQQHPPIWLAKDIPGDVVASALGQAAARRHASEEWRELCRPGPRESDDRCVVCGVNPRREVAIVCDACLDERSDWEILWIWRRFMDPSGYDSISYTEWIGDTH